MVELTKSQGDRARRIHKEAVVVDTHCDTLMHFMPQPRSMPPARKLGERSSRGHIDLPRLIEGGVTCQTFALYTGRSAIQSDALYKALQMVDIYYREFESNEGIIPVVTHGEILTAKKIGNTCGLLSIEGAEPLMGDIGLLRVFYKLGVRMLSFAWNWRTPFADGLYALRSESKLPELGVKALGEMDRLGMIFDVSHLTDSCFWDVADIMNGAFIASHSNCRSLCDHNRNLTDDMIIELANHDGVMGINFSAHFVDKEKATVERVVDHIDHVVELVGPNHIGLGSDFDGIRATPEGLEDVSKMPNITRELVKREYCDEDIIKILGGNHLRVFKKVLR